MTGVLSSPAGCSLIHSQMAKPHRLYINDPNDAKELSGSDTML
jgi:hypothetical protein